MVAEIKEICRLFKLCYVDRWSGVISVVWGRDRNSIDPDVFHQDLVKIRLTISESFAGEIAFMGQVSRRSPVGGQRLSVRRSRSGSDPDRATAAK